MTAREERLSALLELGRPGEAVPELEQLASIEPFRERPRALLIIALYRTGRQAEALAAYRNAWKTFTEELGIEPSPELRELNTAVLNHDSSLDPWRPPAAHAAEPPGDAARGRRRRHRVAALALVVGAAAVVTTAWILAQPQHPRGLAALGRGTVAVLDARSGRLVGQITVGGSPGPESIGAGIVWVGDTAGRTIVAVDAANRRLRRTVGVGTPPYRIAATTGRVWVAGGYDGTLVRLDLVTGLVSGRIRPDPRASGGLALATDGHDLWVASQDGVLSKLDGRDGQRLATVRVPRANAATNGFGSIWLADATRTAVERVSAAGRTMSIPLGAFPFDITSGAGFVWAVSYADGRLWRINPRTNSVTAILRVGAGAAAVAATPYAIWVVRDDIGELVQVDPRSNKIVRRIEFRHHLRAITVAGDNIWVTIG